MNFEKKNRDAKEKFVPIDDTEELQQEPKDINNVDEELNNSFNVVLRIIRVLFPADNHLRVDGKKLHQFFLKPLFSISESFRTRFLCIKLSTYTL